MEVKERFLFCTNFRVCFSTRTDIWPSDHLCNCCGILDSEWYGTVNLVCHILLLDFRRIPGDPVSKVFFNYDSLYLW